MSKPKATFGELFCDVFALTTACVLVLFMIAVNLAPYIAAILGAIWIWRHL